LATPCRDVLITFGHPMPAVAPGAQLELWCGKLIAG
jgi:hypothetical protein